MQLVDRRPPRTGRRVRHAHRPLPRLPRVRDGVPVGRRIRKVGRAGARADRAAIIAGRSLRASRAISFIAGCFPSAAESRARARLRVYQRSGFAACSRHRILQMLGLRDAGAARAFPRIDCEFFFGDLGKTFPAHGTRRARVAFFAGCVAQSHFQRAQSRHDSRSAGQRLRSGRARRSKSAAARFRLMPACAMSPAISRRAISARSPQAISTRSSPTPPAAAQR